MKPAKRTNHYSIEFAHIYTDEKVNGNHFDSLKLALDFLSIVQDSASTMVLIDNYNAHNRGFKTESYLKALEKRGLRPDFYAYESDLVPLAEIFLHAIEKPKIQRMYRSYIERKNKYPCSLLTATWYLVRLGHIDGRAILHRNSDSSRRPIATADRLINILPTAFKNVEKDTHSLISYSAFKDARYNIQPVLFKQKNPVRKSFMLENIINN